MSDALLSGTVLNGTARRADRFYGKYRGIVHENNDPLGMGRLRAKVPEVLRDVPTGWAMPCTPYGGKNYGLHAIPSKGAGVWIEFEAGRVSRPIWSGCWWAKDEVPHDEQDRSSPPPRKILRSESGLMVSLDDAAQTLTIADHDGSNRIVIAVDGGTITIRAARRVVIEAPEIKHGLHADQPAVHGDDLVAYLGDLVDWCSTHAHPSSGSPPALPSPSPPNLLSDKNRVE